MSHYVTLCHTMSHWRPLIHPYPIYPLPASSSNILQLWHPSLHWFPGWTSCCVGWWSAVVDRFVAAVAWRARSTDLSFWFILIHGCSCRSVLHSLHCYRSLYQTIYQFISYRLIQIVFWFFWSVESRVLIWISDCEISPVQVQSAAISWRPLRTLGQDA